MRPGREAGRSPTSNAEVKNDEGIPPLELRLHGVVLNELSTVAYLYRLSP